MSKEERKKLNLKACKLIEVGLSLRLGVQVSYPVREDMYDLLRENGAVGYVDYYLLKCWDKSELINKADVTIYKQLLEIDSKLGTSQTEQLFQCVWHSVQIDFIKV